MLSQSSSRIIWRHKFFHFKGRARKCEEETRALQIVSSWQILSVARIKSLTFWKVFFLPKSAMWWPFNHSLLPTYDKSWIFIWLFSLFFFLLLPLYLLISFYYFIYFLLFFFFTIFIVVFLSFWGHCILHNNLCITLLFSDVSLYKKRTLNKFISFKYDQLKLLIETKLDI